MAEGVLHRHLCDFGPPLRPGFRPQRLHFHPDADAREQDKCSAAPRMGEQPRKKPAAREDPRAEKIALTRRPLLFRS
jgi:hypothetical protein